MAGQPNRTPGVDPTRKRTPWRTYAAVAVGLVALIIIVQNSQSVDIEILFASTTTPLVFALLIMFALGALTGWLLPRVRRGRREEKRRD